MNCPFCNKTIDNHPLSLYNGCIDQWLYTLKNKKEKLSYFIDARDTDHGCHDNIEVEFKTTDITKVYPEYIKQSKLQRVSVSIHLVYEGKNFVPPAYSYNLNSAMQAIEELPKYIEVNIFCRNNIRVVSIEQIKRGGRDTWTGNAMKKQTSLAITRALLHYMKDNK